MILESLRIALRQFLRRPVRSLLVLQGTTWGVALAVFFPALIEGSRENALERASELGLDRLVLEADPTGRPLTRADFESLQTELAGEVQDMAAARVIAVEVQSGASAGKLWLIVETTPGYPGARSYPVARGHFPTTSPEDATIPVAIDPALAREMYGENEALGRALTVQLFDTTEDEPTGVPRTLRIVGRMSQRTEQALSANDLGIDEDHRLAGIAKSMLRSLGIAMDRDDWKQSDHMLYLPLDSLAPEQPLSEIVLRAPPEKIDRLSDRAQLLLADRGIVPLSFSNAGFRVIMNSEIDRYEPLNIALFTTVLVMGAFMIANITLFSVMERYREIAIRRVEGATRRAIVMQFLFEGLILCLIGGLIGVPLGVGLAKLRALLDPGVVMTVHVPVGRSLLAVALATLSGVLASILPARRAARIEPVEALRHE